LLHELVAVGVGDAALGGTKLCARFGQALFFKTILSHMDEGVKKRLETIVESKNLTMEKIYGQKPVSVDEMWA
ncbi:hypothetical protein H6B10_17540, partial [Gemmiger formicilis]|nr:hypothetical protein [Gemmiger formicilis]